MTQELAYEGYKKMRQGIATTKDRRNYKGYLAHTPIEPKIIKIMFKQRYEKENVGNQDGNKILRFIVNKVFWRSKKICDRNQRLLDGYKAEAEAYNIFKKIKEGLATEKDIFDYTRYVKMATIKEERLREKFENLYKKETENKSIS